MSQHATSADKDIRNGVRGGGVSGPPAAASWADGVELSGSNQFCASHVEPNTTTGLDVVILGFLY